MSNKNDDVKLTDRGLTVADIKTNNKTKNSGIMTFAEFSKMLGRKNTQDISPTGYAHAASYDFKIDEAKQECKECGSEECHCELDDNEIDKVVDSATDDDFADLYDDAEFAEVDDEGKPLKESLELDEVNFKDSNKAKTKRFVVKGFMTGAGGKKIPFTKTYIGKNEHEVAALHKRSFGGAVSDIRAQNESEEINEVLSREQRIRQAARFAMTQSRRDRRRQIALHRFSGGKVIAKRARRMAVAILKKRLMKGRDIQKLSVGEKERLESRIEKMKKTVARIAVRLTSKIRQIEKERMSHPKYTKGA
jgi:hypothetical protein